MIDENFERLLSQIAGFGWNPAKRVTNLRIHQIDFRDAKTIFDGYTFVRRSDRYGEVRYQVFGYLEGREIAVICTFVRDLCWLISARRARRDERRKYYDRLPE
jgi:uncharacterized DUF497 family protein